MHFKISTTQLIEIGYITFKLVRKKWNNKSINSKYAEKEGEKTEKV